MTLNELEFLAVTGITSAPQVRDLARWCWDEAEHTGDSRYCGIARMLEMVANYWDDGEPLTKHMKDEIDEVLAAHLPETLAAVDSAEAASLARFLRDQVSAVLETRGIAR